MRLVNYASCSSALGRFSFHMSLRDTRIWNIPRPSGMNMSPMRLEPLTLSMPRISTLSLTQLLLLPTWADLNPSRAVRNIQVRFAWWLRLFYNSSGFIWVFESHILESEPHSC